MAENELIVRIGTLTTEKVLRQIGTSKYMHVRPEDAQTFRGRECGKTAQRTEHLNNILKSCGAEENCS